MSLHIGADFWANATSSPGLLGRLSLFQAITRDIDVILPDIANVFWMNELLFLF